MRYSKPFFWSEKKLISLILYPLTLLTILINFIKKKSFKKKFLIKTICVGNIYVGGTGKTSLVIEINKILHKKYKTVFIKKNYPEQIDEQNLLKKRGNIINANERKRAITIAQKKKFDIAILDDGLQQKNIYYDLSIVCFNSSYGLGNNFLLPAGPLRESINEIKKYDIVFLNGEKKNKKLYSKLKSIDKNIRIFEAKYKPMNLSKLNRNKKYLMFSGIGNPHEFEKTLNKYNFKIKKTLIYPDHYKFKNKEIIQIKKLAEKNNLNLITTEKDFLRLNKNHRKNIKFLKVELEILNIKKFKRFLINKI